MKARLGHVPTRRQLATIANNDTDLVKSLEVLFTKVRNEVAPVHYAQLSSLSLAETSGVVDVLELITGDIENGVFRLTVSFAGTFNTSSDSLFWDVTGDWNSPDFTRVANSTSEKTSFVYEDLIDVDQGAFSAKLRCSITGGGAGSIDLSRINIQLQRIDSR